MTPHEQEWSAVPGTGDVLQGRRVVAQVVHEEDERELSVFIAAAPDMARALMALGDDSVIPGTWHLHECRFDLVGGELVACSCECADVRDALRKAGVIS